MPLSGGISMLQRVAVSDKEFRQFSEMCGDSVQHGCNMNGQLRWDDRKQLTKTIFVSMSQDMMTSGTPLTIAAIAEKTRVNLRVVKFWGDQKVLIPRPETAGAGRGVHRLYDAHELYVAAILGSLGAARIPVGIMRIIAMTLRFPLLRIAGVPVTQIGDPLPAFPGERALRAAMAGKGGTPSSFTFKTASLFPSSVISGALPAHQFQLTNCYRRQPARAASDRCGTPFASWST
jgi:DNA-binding transcriptional MerR regulator